MLQKKVATEVTNLRNGFNYIIKAHRVKCKEKTYRVIGKFTTII